jgi:DNA (cytosine-5)-methyltransferase 1
MVSLNRGEWSEFYSLLFFLHEFLPPREKRDNNILLNEKDYGKIDSIIINSGSNLTFNIEDNFVFSLLDSKSKSPQFSKEEIKSQMDQLYALLKEKKSNRGAFSLPKMEKFLSEISQGEILKGSSQNKADIVLLFKKGSSVLKKGYSIKSNLGSSSTILNASSHTNFRYKVRNINIDSIEKVNSINSSKKLLDRIEKIKSIGGIIVFDKVMSTTFDKNLKKIDENLPSILGEVLLKSYTTNNKKLSELFQMVKSKNRDFEALLKKFLISISFDFFPAEPWNGKKKIENDGLIVIYEDGSLRIYDRENNKRDLENYLFCSSKLESPSSSRFHMLELTKRENDIFFNLNLQVRFK